MLTPLSSAAVIPLQPRFEAWRESWHRQVLADHELGHRAKSVAGFLVWHLNRQSRGAFPSYSTIAAGVGITARNAKHAIAELVSRGHLHKHPRGSRSSNLYLPVQGGGVTTTPGGVATTPGGGVATDPLTSEKEPPNLTRGSSQNPIPIQEGRSLARKEDPSTLPLEDPSSSARYQFNGGSRPAAAGGGVPRGPFIPFDSPKWPLVEKHARSILGFVPLGGRGWQFTNEQWAAIEAAAVANGGGVP